jgi:hypothetical protein
MGNKKTEEVKMPKHPIQPLVTDEHGVQRFNGNKIVRYLLDNGPFTLNHLALKDFSDEDREQFAQLIGYSLSGAGDLSYFSSETYEAAARMADQGLSQLEAENAYLRDKLRTCRDGMRLAVAALYGVAPEDLGDGEHPMKMF